MNDPKDRRQSFVLREEDGFRFKRRRRPPACSTEASNPLPPWERLVRVYETILAQQVLSLSRGFVGRQEYVYQGAREVLEEFYGVVEAKVRRMGTKTARTTSRIAQLQRRLEARTRLLERFREEENTWEALGTPPPMDSTPKPTPVVRTDHLDTSISSTVEDLRDLIGRLEGTARGVAHLSAATSQRLDSAVSSLCSVAFPGMKELPEDPKDLIKGLTVE